MPLASSQGMNCTQKLAKAYKLDARIAQPTIQSTKLSNQSETLKKPKSSLKQHIVAVNRAPGWGGVEGSLSGGLSPKASVTVARHQKVHNNQHQTNGEAALHTTDLHSPSCNISKYQLKCKKIVAALS